MAVYVIHAEGTDLYKIGTAANPRQRMKDLRVGSPSPLRLVAQVPGGRLQEGRIHAELAEHRSHGEWFTLDRPPTVEELTAMAGEVAVYESVLRPVEGVADPVGLVEIAERLGVRPATVGQWDHRNLLPLASWAVSGHRAWHWPYVRAWAEETGRFDAPESMTVDLAQVAAIEAEISRLARERDLLVKAAIDASSLRTVARELGVSHTMVAKMANRCG